MTIAPLFFPPSPDESTRTARAAAFRAAHPGAFASTEDTRAFLGNICLPASGLWAYAMTRPRNINEAVPTGSASR